MAEKRTFPSQASMARRAELTFRAHFPQFDTKLFEVDFNSYVIFTPEADKARDFFEHEFKKRWSPVTLLISLTDRIPEKFIHQIPLLDEDKLHEGYEGLSLSILDIGDLLSIEVPDLPFPLRSRNQNNPIPLIFADKLTAEQDVKVRNFFQRHLSDWPIEISWEAPVVEPKESSPFSVNRIRSATSRENRLPYIRTDEAFWFDNLDVIYRGSQIRYLVPGIQECGASCYVDASVFNQIDIRQLVLLYDTIFVTPPLADGGTYRSTFWASQKISQDDFRKLVSAGRVKLVIVHPEDRLDSEFIKSIYEIDHSAIIGHRALSALIASDVVRTAEEYILLRPEFKHLLSNLVGEIAKQSGLRFDLVNRGILWPAFARNICFPSLLAGGAAGLDNFGLGGVFSEEIKSYTGQDLLIESTATTRGVHIAHVLNATFIPPVDDLAGWNLVRNLTADRLNFYRSFNSRVSAAWTGNEERKIRREQILSQLPLFRFRRYTEIEDIMNVSDFSSTRRKGRALINRISELPQMDQNAEIERLGKAAHGIGAKRERRSFKIDTFDSLLSLADNFASLGLFPFNSAYSTVNLILNIARKSSKFDALVDSIERDVKVGGKNEDLDFLTKINRVAEIDH